MKKILTLFAICGLTLVLTGCPAESDARDAIAGAHGWIVNAQLVWSESCQKDNTQLKCTSTNKLIDAQHLAADSLQIYCSGSPKQGELSYADGGVCVPLKGYQDGLIAAIQKMNDIILDVKTLLAKEPL